MKATDFTVVKSPMLTKVTKHPSIGFANYERRLGSMQSVMQSMRQAYLGTRERAIVVLEGWDTAGKGRFVRRLGWALDPRSFKVYPIAAPLSRQRGRHYLQRFWEELPDPGQIVVFDRSWYGRVLVERVDGGYEEINEFERTMADDGVESRTSQRWAPWYLIAANDKPYGRLATFAILIARLHLKPRPLDSKVAEMATQLIDLP